MDPITLALGIIAGMGLTESVVEATQEGEGRITVATINAIDVGCHLCHAQCGQPCRWGCGPGEFHNRRVNFAQRMTEDRAKDFEMWALANADIHHAIAQGDLCELGADGFCRVCGDDGRFFRRGD